MDYIAGDKYNIVIILAVQNSLGRVFKSWFSNRVLTKSIKLIRIRSKRKEKNSALTHTLQYSGAWIGERAFTFDFSPRPDLTYIVGTSKVVKTCQLFANITSLFLLAKNSLDYISNRNNAVFDHNWYIMYYYFTFNFTSQSIR